MPVKDCEGSPHSIEKAAPEYGGSLSGGARDFDRPGGLSHWLYEQPDVPPQFSHL